jgi:hypothetical protein
MSRAGRREVHELVTPAGRLGQAAQHSKHIIADPGTWVAERRDVDAWPGRARRLAASVCARSGMSGTMSFRRCTEVRRPSSSHRSSKALGSRSWRRWRQERRPSSPRIRRWTKRAVTRRYGSIPGAPKRSRQASSKRLPNERHSCRKDSSTQRKHAAQFTWRACGGAILRGYENARG